jgi:hypothetical protein
MVPETDTSAVATVDVEFELQLLQSVLDTTDAVDVGGHCGGCIGCSGCVHLD